MRPLLRLEYEQLCSAISVSYLWATPKREGSRIEVFLFGEIRVFHRPHPRPDTDKGAVASLRKWLSDNEVEP